MFKKVLIFTVLMVLLCGSIASATGTLTIISWPNYRCPSLIGDFEKKFNTKVNFIEVSTYEEMYEFISKNPGKADMLILTELVIPQLIAENKLLPLNKALIPNIKNADPLFLNMPYDTANKYTLPYHYILFGLAYNAKKISDSEATLQNYFEASGKLKGRVVTFPEARYNIGLALKYMGKSFNSQKKSDLDMVKVLLKNLKANAIPGSEKLDRDIYDALTQISTGKADLTISYYESKVSLSALNASFSNNSDIRFKIPKEGALLGTDAMCIFKDSKNSDLANQFINFMYDPQNAAKSVAFLGYAFPVKGVDKLIDPALAKQIYISVDLLRKCETMAPLKDVESEVYTKMWNEIFNN